MQNDTPDPEKTLPPQEDDGTTTPPTDADRTVIAGAVVPPSEDPDRTVIEPASAPEPEDDRTQIVTSAPVEDADDRTQIISDAPPAVSPPTADALPDDPVEETTDSGISTPPVTTPPEADDTGISTPPTTAAPIDADTSGIESPPVTEAPTDAENGIASPPKTEAPADDTGLASPPTADETPEADDDIASPPVTDDATAETSGIAVPPVVEDLVEEAAPEPDVVAEEPSIAPPPDDLSDAPIDEPSAPKDAVPVGTMINNNYEIKELISAGGMGEVFRGVNAFTGDAVAIKIVLQSLANDSKIAALFMREAKVLCGLSDNAIVRYFNFVKDAALDRFCLIMEFIDGVSLSDFVRDERPLTEDEARGLLRRVARGLDRAHQMDVVHRDLSPDNVMLRDGKVSEAVLIDFGIAKSTEMAENTLHGQLAGKFKYISPEQLGHFGGEIGPRTDIYGLGLLMAAALRGEPLDMGASVVEAVNARREIPDLSDVPDGMRPLLAHMLEPDPIHRPARMLDVIRLLDHPADIPAKYGGARPVADGQTQPPAGQQPVGLTTPGLQQPPMQTGAPGLIPPAADATSASPFGGPTGVAPGTFAPGVTAAPGTFAPGQNTMAGTPARRRSSDGGGGIGRWILILLVIGGLGGFVAWQQGLIPNEMLPEGLRQAEATENETLDDPVTSTPSGPMTRASFLANFDAGPCSYATRIATGPQAGVVATFSNTDGAFSGLADAFEDAFDSRPTISTTAVLDTHCAALDMGRTLQQTEGAPPILVLDSNEMQSGGSIVGRLSDRRGRPVWLVLITAAGGVYNLTDRMTEGADGSATFSFGLNSDGSGEPQPQMIMAVASDAPLIAAAAANNGARASDLLPLIEAEIAGRDGRAGAAIAVFDLLP